MPSACHTVARCAAHCVTAALIIAALISPVYAQDVDSAEKRDIPSQAFHILAWNIEFGGSDVATIKAQLDDLAPFDILALSEVPKKSASEFTKRWGEDSFIVGEKGGEASLLIAWDKSKFEKVRVQELTRFADQDLAPGIQAAPLIAQLRRRRNNQEFLVVMNHLARGSDELRRRQAQLLVDWAKQQNLPVIAVGGYNFDYDIPTKKGNAAFDTFLSDGTWQWVDLKQQVDTNWADRNRDGKDDYPNSMLDFAFASGPAKHWKILSEILVRENDFPDNDKTSDQRPIRTTVLSW